jgi:hypothetical protein
MAIALTVGVDVEMITVATIAVATIAADVGMTAVEDATAVVADMVMSIKMDTAVRAMDTATNVVDMATNRAVATWTTF